MDTHDSPSGRPDAVGRPEGADRELESLVSRIAAGQRAALRPLYEVTVEMVHSIAARVLGDASLADDAVTETFLYIWRRATRYDAERATVKGWVALIARSRAIDLKRRRANERERGVADLVSVADGRVTPRRSPDPDGPGLGDAVAAASRNEEVSVLRDALDALTAEQRAALECAFFDGLTHVEVAERLDAPLGTIKTRIRSALAQLRSRLGSLGADSGMIDQVVREAHR